MVNLFTEAPENGAHFSECGKYRFILYRIWDRSKPMIMFIGLNPSTANATDDDPTIRRVKRFANDWGFGGVYMANCFPFISTDPNMLHQGETTYNFQMVKAFAANCEKIVFAWGRFNVVKDTGTDKYLSKMFPGAYCLGHNANGSPKHPLYIYSKQELIKYQVSC